MKTYMMVWSNPVSDEREESFNAWYDDVHIPEITALAGVNRATRFTLTETQSDGPAPDHKYLTVYEIDGDDVQGVVDAIKVARPTMTGTDTIQVGTVKSMTVRQLGV